MSSRTPRSHFKNDATRHLWQIAAARDLIVLLVVVLVLWALFQLRAIFLPLLIALLLAHIFNPLVSSLEKRWGCPRPLTAAVLLAMGVFGLAAFLSWFGRLLLEQITELMLRLPEYLRSLAASANLDRETFRSKSNSISGSFN